MIDTERVTYVAGLCVGQACEATGFAVLKRRCWRATGCTGDTTYTLGQLIRYPVRPAVDGTAARKAESRSVLGVPD
jgi:hypothetical protein